MRKLLPFILVLSLLSCGTTKQVDLVDLFNNAQQGDVITIPTGNHTITAPLVVKSWQIIYGNGSVIYADGDFPIFDFSGASRVTSHNLRTNDTSNAKAAVWLSRAPSGHGAGNRFYDSWFDGNFSVATVWSNSEGNNFYNTTFVTRTDKPTFIYNGSNTTGAWRDCVFLNYGTAEYVPLIQLGQTVSGLLFDGGYLYSGVNGTAFQVTGTASTITMRDMRQEGTGADSLFLDNVGTSSLYQYDIQRINYTPLSDYMIHAPKIMHECNLDLTWGNAATRYVHVDGAASKLWRCTIKGNKTDWVTLTDGAQLRMNHLHWVQGNPLPVVGDNVVEWTN